MSTKQSKMTIAVDFDATLANYENWEVNGENPGGPRPDVVEGLQRLKDAGWIIGIHSTRNTEVISEWVVTHNLSLLIDFINDNPDQPDGCSHKPISFIYIDDRASRYNGENMNEIVDSIIDGDMEPWYKS
jgi:hypothetical protein